MKPRNHDIANELQDLVPGAAWTELTPVPGDVPAGYFDQLPLQIMQKIETEDLSPFLSNLPKTITFSAPDGYFDQLPDQIMQKIAVQEELETISPFLSTAPKTVPLTVPADYFEQLTANVLAEVKKPAPAKVIRIHPYIRWAVAACLIAVVSTFVYNRQGPREMPETPFADNTLADVSDQAIVEYLQTHMDAFDKDELLSLASLNTTTPGTVDLPETNELSDEAIQRYLDKTGFLKESPTDH